MKDAHSARVTGLFIAHNHFDEAGNVESLCIVQADPLIYVSDALLDQPPSSFVEYGEGIFVVKGRNGTVRYRLLRHYDAGHWSAQRIDHNAVPDNRLTCDYADAS